MATLSEIRERVYRILSDPSGQQFSADLIDDGIVASLDAILPWLFKPAIETLEGDGELVSFELPVDLYMTIAVFDTEKGYYIPKNTLSAGQAPGENIVSNQDWMEYPNGYLNFANAPEGDVIVHYAASWEKPVDDDDELEAPPWCHTALVFYAASYSLLEKSSSASNIRQWNVSVDSGTPAMNPMRDMSAYFLERFGLELSRMPGQARGVNG